MGEEKHTGFRITPSLLSGGIAAGCYGDLIMCLYQRGEALRTESGRDGPHPQSGGKETVREHSETQERTAHQREKLPVCLRSIFEGTGETRKKKRVGITGEIYMKCSKLGNDDIESFLLRQGMEPYSGGFVNYCLYLVDTERYKVEKYQRQSHHGESLCLCAPPVV